MDSYHAKKFHRTLSPDRAGPHTTRSNDGRDQNYRHDDQIPSFNEAPKVTDERQPRKRRRWDVTSDDKSKQTTGEWAIEAESKPQPLPTPSRRTKWDMTPQMVQAETPSRKSRWDQTPVHIAGASAAETPKSASRWDQTPGGPKDETKSEPMTPSSSRTDEGSLKFKENILTDAELDSLLPQEGYEIVEPPADYTPSKRIQPASSEEPSFYLQSESQAIQLRNQFYGFGSKIPDDLPFSKPEDFQLFAKLLDGKTSEHISVEEAKERKILRLILIIKNGTPQTRKSSMKMLVDKIKELNPAIFFNILLPLLMSPSLEEQERHLFVKLIDRIMYKLGDEIRPFVHKILTVLEPMLIDENYYARVEAREIISNLSKAAGLATMISTIRPDIDHPDEYVRNTTARAFSVVSSSLGVPNVLPFIKAVCSSKKSWQARHTGLKIIQQIAILIGVGVLPHLQGMIECIGENIEDEQPKVRTMAALAVAALAESCTPHGIESFEVVLQSLWKGLKNHRGKALAAFIKAVGYVVPLMDKEYASFYSKEVLNVLVREFSTPDEEMKKILLKVLKQLCQIEGVSVDQLKERVLPEFFSHFWVRRMALDRRNYRAVIDCTVQLADRVGSGLIIGHLIDHGLRDESESFRKMVLECVRDVVLAHGTNGVAPGQQEELLMDGLMYCFQEATTDDSITIDAFSTVLKALGRRSKLYLTLICNTILWRVSNKSSLVRMLAMDLIGKVAPLLDLCEEHKLLSHMSTVLYESLNEEYPEVLGSILTAYKDVIVAIGIDRIEPSAKELLPRLTPIMRNRHEKVQEACVDLVGRIAERASECASPREWMRICFELLDNLKAPQKSIRRACINTFGWIAKAVGPQDVLVTLLNNLKVQERTNRVSTTIAIAIVAEICGPFTVLPSLLNEYRVPEQNVQNGVLKSLAFLYEYIGEISKDYVYPIITLLEDALMDRDLVHRQIASSVIKHLSLSIMGFSRKDALLHLLNFVWPDCLETSPHMVMTFFDALDGLRVSLGPGYILQYVVQGLAHPARRIRDRFWTIYNQLYIGAQHSLVAFYPNFPSSSQETSFQWYPRSELEMFL